jgi:hypothetical protein
MGREGRRERLRFSGVYNYSYELHIVSLRLFQASSILLLVESFKRNGETSL